VFSGFICGRACWIGVTKIASGLLSICCCCGVRFVGESHLGILLFYCGTARYLIGLLPMSHTFTILANPKSSEGFFQSR
jgi:hypothetical protein